MVPQEDKLLSFSSSTLVPTAFSPVPASRHLAGSITSRYKEIEVYIISPYTYLVLSARSQIKGKCSLQLSARGFTKGNVFFLVVGLDTESQVAQTLRLN